MHAGTTITSSLTHIATRTCFGLFLSCKPHPQVRSPLATSILTSPPPTFQNSPPLVIGVLTRGRPDLPGFAELLLRQVAEGLVHGAVEEVSIQVFGCGREMWRGGG